MRPHWGGQNSAHPSSIAQQHPLATQRLYGGHCGQLTVLAVEGELGADNDIGYAIAVGETEGGVILEMASNPFEPPAGLGCIARIHQCHPPRFSILLMHFHPVVLHVEGDITHVKEIIGEYSLIT